MKAIQSGIWWQQLLPAFPRLMIRAISVSASMVVLLAPSTFAQHHDPHRYSTHHYEPAGHFEYGQSYGQAYSPGHDQPYGGGYLVHGSSSQGFGGTVGGTHGVYSHDYVPPYTGYSHGSGRSNAWRHGRHQSIYIRLFGH